MTAYAGTGLGSPPSGYVAVDWELDAAWLAQPQLPLASRAAAAGLRWMRWLQDGVELRLRRLEVELAERNGMPHFGAPLAPQAAPTANFYQLQDSVFVRPSAAAWPRGRSGWARWWLARCSDRPVTFWTPAPAGAADDGMRAGSARRGEE